MLGVVAAGGACPAAAADVAGVPGVSAECGVDGEARRPRPGVVGCGVGDEVDGPGGAAVVFVDEFAEDERAAEAAAQFGEEEFGEVVEDAAAGEGFALDSAFGLEPFAESVFLVHG